MTTRGALTRLTILVFVILLTARATCIWGKNLYVIPVQSGPTGIGVVSSYSITAGAPALNHVGTCAWYENVGLAMDSNLGVLFVTREFVRGIDIVDAAALISIGEVFTSSDDYPDMHDFGGIAVDQTHRYLYTAGRNTTAVYRCTYGENPLNIDVDSLYPKTLMGCTSIWGMALDDITGVLWVADPKAGKVLGYDTTAWTLTTTVTVAGIKPCGIAVDRVRGYLYVTCPDYLAPAGQCVFGTILGSGGVLLQQYTTSGTFVDQISMGHGGMGVAVDEGTGHVYVTGGCNGNNISVWDPDLELVGQTGEIGDPAGIVVSQTDFPGEGDILGLNKINGWAVSAGTLKWNLFRGAESGSSLISGVGAFLWCVADPNNSSKSAWVQGDGTYGGKVQVKLNPPEGGTFQYGIKRVDVDPNTSINLSFGFTARTVTVLTPDTNTGDVVVDWLGGTAEIPGDNTAGDDLVPPGSTVTLKKYAGASISVRSVAGTQTVRVRALK